jgi:site-specific DNA-methyltransferase (adenine-specific)
MRHALLETGNIKSMPPYEDVVRPFVMDGSKEFTDVWTFPSVRPYKGKHPAEKPAAMLEHAIEATTFPGDIVLDCFGGGGSTALAALKLKRRTVSMEIESHWAAEIASRIEDATEDDIPFASARNGNGNGHLLPRINGSKSRQLALFAAGK